jgi:uncharacterized protein (TIGR00730 family)
VEKKYRVGDQDIEELIEKFTGLTALPGTEHLLREIFTTVVKLGKESGDKGDLKLVNNALKELRYSFKIFAPYRRARKVVIFGSARSKPTSPEYKMADQFARKLSDKCYMIVTGGGGGVMEAGNKGAVEDNHFALNIRLPFEQKANPYVNKKEKLINFKYFFTRKLIFIKETDATALFPGGFGTNDEGFEALTLVQTGKSKPRPIVMMEPKGSSYWKGWKRFVTEQMMKKGYIDKRDMSLFRIFSDVDEAVQYIEDFYRIYHSIRYISGMTIIRLNKKISEKTLSRLNREFKDILTGGDIRPSLPLEEEVHKQEHVELPRLVMRFNQREYGRLWEMIDQINADGFR